MKIIKKQTTKKLFLSLELISTKFKKPKYTIFLNGNNVELTPVITIVSEEKEIHEYSLSYNELTSFVIDFLNKKGSDTLVENNLIIGDVVIVIKKIIIEDIDFSDKINLLFEYKDNYGTKYQTSGFMHVSGTMSMNIRKNIMYTHWITSYDIL
jgi:hypothetical protein